MRIESYRYRFRQPLLLNGQRQEYREGAWVHWQMGNRAITTEVAPLPGFSRGTLAEAIAQLEAGQPRCPSACFATEAAHYQASFGLPRGQVEVCGFAGSGQAVQKLKISGLADVDSINGTKARLRLDANRQLSRATLLAICDRINLDQIDYFEEPLADLEDYPGLGLPVAFDETLRQSPLPPVVYTARAWVLKPMLLGLTRTLELAGLARQHGIEVVLSSSHESRVTLDFYHSLARDLNLTSAQGLDTLDLLEPSPC